MQAVREYGEDDIGETPTVKIGRRYTNNIDTQKEN